MIESIYVISQNLILLEKHFSFRLEMDERNKIIDQYKNSQSAVTTVDDCYFIRSSKHGSDITLVALLDQEKQIGYVLSILEKVREIFTAYIGIFRKIKYKYKIPNPSKLQEFQHQVI